MESNQLLMIFVRNARIGRVKTRLAASIGDEAALELYIRMLEYTAATTSKVKSDKAVFYSDFIDEVDEFDSKHFQKFLQFGSDLGERMKNAFVKGFGRAYNQIIIIGSDCMELNEEILSQAFLSLESNDVVIGPAKDGGYYLLGMKKLHASLFEEIQWSSENVFLDTLLKLKKEKLTYAVLPELRDVDVYEDLPEELRISMNKSNKS
jgi:rSAM/selenodomain-associated transferase 1